MKFGSELNDRSISKWRNYNIDYNDLKQKIKRATSEFQSKKSTSLSSQSSNETDVTLSTTGTDDSLYLEKLQKKLLKQLYKSFKEQIEFVSLFVNSKYGEISRRILTTKKQLNIFINDSSASTIPSSMQRRLKNRKLVTIQKELESLSQELQSLSRFILLQKIAIRKLFKKFIKYSEYQYKQELVDKITIECLNDNPDSFVNLYLNDAALELTLMFDVIGNYCNNIGEASPSTVAARQQLYHQQQQDPNIRERQQSVATLDSLTLPTLAIDYASSSNKFIYSKATTFDLVSHKKGPMVQRFWVHKDNLDEISFLLLSEFKLISDDTGLIDEDDQQQQHQEELQKVQEQRQQREQEFKPSSLPIVQLKTTKSSADLMKQHNDTSVETSVSHTKTKRPSSEHDPEGSNYDNEDEITFRPYTKVISLWLNNLDDPTISSTKGLFSHSSIDDALSGDMIGQVTITHTSTKLNTPLLIAPIGGLRQFSMATVDDNIIDLLFNNNTKLSSRELKNQIVKKWKASGSIGNPKMAQLALDWCVDKKVKPLVKLMYNRTRFISLSNDVQNDHSKSKIECFITLDSYIQSSKLNTPEDISLNWTSKDSFGAIQFPHSILEIRYDSPLKTLPTKIQALIDSHLVYKVDHLNFSMNNYLLVKYFAERIPDDLILDYIAPWFDDFQNKDIRKLPSISKDDQNDGISISSRNNNKTNQSSSTGGGGILLNKNEALLTQQQRQLELQQNRRYWNEFDDGSDQEDNGFYYDDDNDSDDDYNSNHNTFFGNLFGFGFLTPERIDSILTISNKISDKFNRFYRRNSLSTSPADTLNESGDSNDPILKYSQKHHFYHSLINGEMPQRSNSDTDTDLSDHNGNGYTRFSAGRGTVRNSISSNPYAYDDVSPTTIAKDLEHSRYRERQQSFIHGANKPNELIEQLNHDKILSFIYLTCLVLSFLTTGIGLGVIFSILGESKDPSFKSSNQLILIVCFGFGCLIISLILSGIGVCLLMSRYVNAPLWHHAIVWTTFFVVSCLLVVSVCSCF